MPSAGTRPAEKTSSKTIYFFASWFPLLERNGALRLTGHLVGLGTIERLAWRSRLRAVPFSASEQGRGWDPPRFSVFKRAHQPPPALA